MGQKKKFQNQLRVSLPDRKAPYQAQIQSVDTNREQVLFDDSSKGAPVRYPFVSAKSWVRSMPSAGARVVVAYNSISRRLETVGYEFPQAEDQITKYKSRQSLYRPLKEGEHEVMSSGQASSFWGSYPVKVDRAGVVSTRHDGLKLEYAVRAPNLIWRGPRHRHDVVGHEMRIGAVKRSTSANKESYALKMGSLPEAGSFIFASEYLLALNADVTDAPLVDIRTGEVFDDALTPGYPMAAPALGVNSLPLRHRAKYFVTIDPTGVGVPDTSTDLEIDSLGNVALTLSKLSVIGLAVKVPLGRVLVACGLDMTLDAKLGIVLTTAGKVQIKGTAGVEVTTPANVTISGDTGVSIKSSANVSISASGKTDIESTGPTNIKSSANISIEATGTAVLKSTGPTSVESMGPVSISGKAGVTLKGTAGGAAARPINTLPIDPFSGIPTWTDATVMA